jgi:hypothetical protein
MTHTVDHDPVTDAVVRRECAACYAGWSAMVAELATLHPDMTIPETERLIEEMREIVSRKIELVT